MRYRVHTEMDNDRLARADSRMDGKLKISGDESKIWQDRVSILVKTLYEDVNVSWFKGRDNQESQLNHVRSDFTTTNVIHPVA